MSSIARQLLLAPAPFNGDEIARDFRRQLVASAATTTTDDLKDAPSAPVAVY
jgi:hypothetical protein